MAKKIKGITIELGGDTSKFQKALTSAESAIKQTQRELKSLDKALKIDPGNSEMLARKQELLNRVYDETNNKLNTLKDAYKKALDPAERTAAIEKVNNKIQEQQKRIEDATAAMAGLDKGTEEYRQQQTEIDKANRAIESYNQQIDEINANHQAEALKAEIMETEAALKSAKKEAEGFGSVFAQQAAAAGASLQEIGGKLTSVGEGMTKSVTAPIAGVAAASVAAWSEVDKAYDVLIAKTGATGEAFEGLKGVTESIATTIPTSFDTAAQAVGEVNTRFGVTGQELETLSAQFVKFAKLNNTDVSASVDGVQSALNAFGLGAESASAFLDYLNMVGQNTGVSMDTLTSGLISNGTAFQALGLDIAGATSLLGALEVAGIDSSTVMTGLSKAQADAMQTGATLQDTLTQAFSSAGDAIDIFGAKAGPKLYEAMQNGVISISDFTANTDGLSAAVGNLSDTYEATISPLDQMTTTMNDLKATGADIVESAGPLLVDILQRIAEAVKGVNELWTSLDDDQKQNIITLLAVVATIGPLLVVIGKVATGIGALLKLAPLISAAMATVSGFITATLIPTIGGIITAAAPILASAAPFAALAAALVAAGWLVVNNWDTIKETFLNIVEDIKTGVVDKFERIKNFIGDAIERIKGLFDFEWHLPDIKLPHFSISGGFSLNPPRIPHIDVDWYRKAEQTPYLFNSPQVIGVGDVPEVVIGADAFRRMQGGGTMITNNINAVINNDTDVEDLTRRISARIQTDIDRKYAAWR